MNIEELCVENDNFALKDCSRASKVLIDFYVDLPKNKRRDFNYIENQIINTLITNDLDDFKDVLEDGNILKEWCELYSRMYARIEYFT